LQATSFFSRVSQPEYWGEAAMYYGLYLIALALVVMAGQLAFVLSFFLS
jgi:hypothetical protein